MGSQHREDLPFKASAASTDYVIVQEADAKNARRYYVPVSVLTGGGGTMTAAEILAALVTVDGAGSGLDADTLDGLSSAAFELAGVAAALVDDLSGVSSTGTARTNLGVGTGDSPQFTAINLGHASDTTITRVSAGVIAVEGATIAKVSDLASYLPLLAGGAAVENLGAVESNVNTVAATGATETLDTSVYGVHDCTMDQNCTFTFSNPAPSGKLSSFVLVLRGAFTPTLPAAVKWSGGAAPTYTTPAIYTFTTVDAGTTWYGAQVGKAFA